MLIIVEGPLNIADSAISFICACVYTVNISAWLSARVWNDLFKKKIKRDGDKLQVQTFRFFVTWLILDNFPTSNKVRGSYHFEL